MSFREAMPPEPPTRGSAPGPHEGLPFPRPPVPPPPNPGYATEHNTIKIIYNALMVRVGGVAQW